MKRREFIALAGACAAFPRVALAQQVQRKAPRVALVSQLVLPDLGTAAGVAAFNSSISAGIFLPELARLGFIEGQTVTFDRYSAPNSSDLNGIARTIVASRPDLIVSLASSVMPLALMASTTAIPILAGTADPINAGIVRDLLPTRRNLAVVSGTASSDYEGKNLALLAEAVPAARRVAYVFASSPLNPTGQNSVRVVTDAAPKLGLSLAVITAVEAGDEPAFRDALMQAKSNGVEMVQFGRNAQVGNASAILARLALEYGLPAISNYHPFSRAGGLMSYGQGERDQYTKVAGYAALILNGTNPGTLPVVQPEFFELIVNLTTAKALGIKIPPSIVAQATQVLE